MSVHAELPFERFRYWQGQRLRARDLVDQIAEADRATRWHNRSVHSAFGVRFGYDVAFVASTERRRIRIECGVAYDCSGAVLALQRPRELTVPALENGQSVVLLLRSRHARGHCGCGSNRVHAEGIGRSSMLEDEVQFDWTSSRLGDPHAGVQIVRVSRDGSGETSLDPSLRTHARPLARPRLASGSTIPGLTPWEPALGGFQTRVDTSAAGFTRIPAYFAALSSTRTGGRLQALAFVFGFAHVEQPSLTDFVLRVLVPAGLRNLRFTTPAEIARDIGLVVCWLGCQPPEFAPPLCPGQRDEPLTCRDAE